MTEKQKRSNLFRVHNKLIESIKRIREKRKEKGLKDLSYVELSLLITKHKNYEKNIEPHMINYLGYEDE